MGILNKVFYSFKDRNFKIYFFTRSLTLTGFSVQQIAFLWLMYELTESALLVGISASIRQVANFIMSPVSGVLADRVSKKRLLFYSQLFRMIIALSLGLLLLFDWYTVTLLFMGQLLMGMINGLEMPVRQSFLFTLATDKKYLNNIIALHSTSINIGKILGPFCAALLIPLIGEWVCYLLFAASLLSFLIGLQFIEIKENVQPENRTSFIKEYIDGFRYSFHNYEIRRTLIMMMIVAFFGFSFVSVLSYLVGEGYEKGSSVLGFMHTVMGAGALLGTFIIAGNSDYKKLQHIRFVSVFLYPAFIFMFASFEVLLFKYVLLFLIGLMQVCVFTTSKSFAQLEADDQNIGRLSGVYIAVLMGAVTLGSTLMGYLSDRFTAEIVISYSSTVCIILLLLFMLLNHTGKMEAGHKTKTTALS